MTCHLTPFAFKAVRIASVLLLISGIAAALVNGILVIPLPPVDPAAASIPPAHLLTHSAEPDFPAPPPAGSPPLSEVSATHLIPEIAKYAAFDTPDEYEWWIYYFRESDLDLFLHPEIMTDGNRPHTYSYLLERSDGSIRRYVLLCQGAWDSWECQWFAGTAGRAARLPNPNTSNRVMQSPMN